MNGAEKAACRVAVLLLLFALSSMPARAQFGGAEGGGEMMTQMAPMLEMMKAKMGKRRFSRMMQTMAPMMSRMMENGGGMAGTAGGFGGGSAFAPQGYGVGMGGGDFMGMLGGAGGSDMMSMIPQLMQIANFGGGRYGHRRRRHR